MSSEIIARTYSPQERDTIGREAFYGDHKVLDHYVLWCQSYWEGGQRYPANGMSLAHYLHVVKDLINDGNLARLIDPDLPARITRNSEQWGITRQFAWADMFGDLVPMPEWF